MRNNVHIVNATCRDLRALYPIIRRAYLDNDTRHSALAAYKITVLPAYNPDGSARWIIDNK